ncbi:hypothetical protein VYU27_008543 [Nannochloropsis oceanica]
MDPVAAAMQTLLLAPAPHLSPLQRHRVQQHRQKKLFETRRKPRQGWGKKRGYILIWMRQDQVLKKQKAFDSSDPI